MIRVAVAAAIALLAGCASYSEIQAREPSVDLVTTKAPTVYAGCLAPKFMEIWPGLVSVIPDGENTVISVGASGQAMTATVTIEPSGRITMRETAHVELGTVFQRARDATRSCI